MLLTTWNTIYSKGRLQRKGGRWTRASKRKWVSMTRGKSKIPKLVDECKLSAKQMRFRVVHQGNLYQHVGTPFQCLTNRPCHSAWSQRLMKTSCHLPAIYFVQLESAKPAGLMNMWKKSSSQTSSSAVQEKQCFLMPNIRKTIIIIFSLAIKEQVNKALYSTVLSDKKSKKVFMQLSTEDTAAYTSEVVTRHFFFFFLIDVSKSVKKI